MSLGCRRVYKWVGSLSGRITPSERQACVRVCSSLVSRTVNFQALYPWSPPVLSAKPAGLDVIEEACSVILTTWALKDPNHGVHLALPWLSLLAISLITSIPTPGKSKVSLLSASYERAWRTVASWCPPVSKLILTILNFSYIISFLLQISTCQDLLVF